MSATNPGDDKARLSPRERRARENARPFLHRATLHVSFRPLKDETAKAQPASLCAFLLRNGVQSVVIEEVPTMPDIRLTGTPDLDRVQALIESWQAAGGAGDDQPLPGP